MSVVLGYLNPRGGAGAVCRHWQKIVADGRAGGFKDGPEVVFRLPPEHPRRAAGGAVPPLEGLLTRCRLQEQARWAYFGYVERPRAEDGRLGSHAQVRVRALSCLMCPSPI